MKKKIISLCLVVCLLAVAIIGGTMAYFTDTDSANNTMTLGNVDIDQNEYQRKVDEDGNYVTGTFDGQTSYVLENFVQDKPLMPIVGDPNEPGNSPAFAGWDNTIVRMTQVGSYGSMQVFAGKNAQDKFITVKNTGKSDAYVRTLVAIEVGSSDGSKILTSSRAGTDTAPWVCYSLGETVKIGNSTYMVMEFVYRGASDVNRHVNGVLTAGETTYPSLCQIYLKHNTTNAEVKAIDANENGKLDILTLSQAVQTAGFEDAQTALDTAFGEVTAENVAAWFAK